MNTLGLSIYLKKLFQISNETMKNTGEYKNRSNEFHKIIQYIADLIGPLYICHFSLSITYISDPKRKYS